MINSKLNKWFSTLKTRKYFYVLNGIAVKFYDGQILLACSEVIVQSCSKWGGDLPIILQQWSFILLLAVLGPVAFLPTAQIILKTSLFLVAL